MNIWRAVRGELTGAWRSLRYDLRRRRAAGGPFAAYDRPPRHLLALSSFGVLALTGAVGSYFAVVGGVSAVLDGGAPSGPGQLPAVTEHGREAPGPGAPTPQVGPAPGSTGSTTGRPGPGAGVATITPPPGRGGTPVGAGTTSGWLPPRQGPSGPAPTCPCESTLPIPATSAPVESGHPSPTGPPPHSVTPTDPPTVEPSGQAVVPTAMRQPQQVQHRHRRWWFRWRHRLPRNPAIPIVTPGPSPSTPDLPLLTPRPTMVGGPAGRSGYPSATPSQSAITPGNGAFPMDSH